MEVTGKIIVALPEVSGTSKAGNAWKKRSYVLETLDNYPTKIAFEFFGERADQYPLSVGEEIKLSFDIDSHEYQGRWFTSIRGWKAEKTTGGMGTPAAPTAVPANDPFAAAAPAQTFSPSNDATDDLPF
ncbi:MAG: DUF3127 domain-containing protein [Clostridiales bacterium]|nr:DUF3127 domain-containing protein [Clostridiales bacterium]